MDFLIADIPYFQTPNDIFDTDLTNNEKLTYMYICRCANNGKAAFPSYQTIADKCGFSKATAKRSMTTLVSRRLISKQYRYKDNKNYSNVYKVNYNISGVMMNPPEVMMNPPGVTVNPNKELSINKSLKTNKYLHQSEIDVVLDDNTSMIQILEEYSQKAFNKSIRGHKGIYDFEVLCYMDSEDFWNFLCDNVTSYDYCNFDYLISIEGRAK